VDGSHAPPIITSPANPTIALVRALGRADRRAAEGAFVVEGMRAIRDALQTGAAPRLLLVRQDAAAVAGTLPIPHGVPVRFVASSLFDRLSDVQTPQGLLAVFPIPDLPLPRDDPAPLVLIVDRVRDPGNLGALLRAAAGSGATAVYRTPETVDPWNPKVVRAGMGAHFRIPLASFDTAAREDLRRLPRRVVATASGTRSYDAVDWIGPAALVIGGETEGVSPDLVAWSTEEAGIPLTNDLESLNAAVAGSVILFEAARQRRRAG
jgi:TrmH family RNA methyltransferase